MDGTLATPGRMALNAALNIGTRNDDRQNISDSARAGRRERYQTLLARVRSRQLDLAMAGRVQDSARYARRASRLAQRIVIVAGLQMSDELPMSHAQVEEPMLECCGA